MLLCKETSFKLAHHDEDGADAQQVGQREASTRQAAGKGCDDHGRCIDCKGQEQGPPAEGSTQYEVSKPAQKVFSHSRKLCSRHVMCSSALDCLYACSEPRQQLLTHHSHFQEREQKATSLPTALPTAMARGVLNSMLVPAAVSAAMSARVFVVSVQTNL